MGAAWRVIKVVHEAIGKACPEGQFGYIHPAVKRPDHFLRIGLAELACVLFLWGKITLMKFAHLLAAAVMTAASLDVSAQKLRLKDGNYDALKGTTKFNMKYDYADMTVTTKKLSEPEFINTKKEELNKKESGRGSGWAASWVNDREARFEPQFKEEFEKQSGMQVGSFPDAKYTMIFHTTHTETGYNIGISSRPAYIDGYVKIVETANPSSTVALISVDNAPGRMAFGMDFDTGVRLAEAYAKAGKEVGKLIRKKVD